MPSRHPLTPATRPAAPGSIIPAGRGVAVRPTRLRRQRRVTGDGTASCEECGAVTAVAVVTETFLARW